MDPSPTVGSGPVNRQENVRDIYLTDNRAEAEVLIDKTIAGCADDEVSEIRSLGKTLASWRTEILAHHDTGASNGPTAGLNLCVKKVKRLLATGSDRSRTTGSASCSTPAASPGQHGPARLASEPALPTQKRRATYTSTG